MKPKFLLRIGLIIAIQSNAILLAQSNEGDSTPETSISIEDGKVKISVNFHEPFRWEKTRYESIKTFPMRGGSEMSHSIRFKEKGGVSWRQTDVVFSGTFNIKEISSKDLLDKYIEKHGGFGVRTWSIDDKGNFKSFNERTGQYEILTPGKFSEEYGLEFKSDEYTVEASISGYLVEIIGVFDPETNLLNFDTLDYAPFFYVPKLIIEQSKDLKNWSTVKLSDPLPKEYQWPQELSIEMEAELKESTFYRVKVVEE